MSNISGQIGGIDFSNIATSTATAALISQAVSAQVPTVQNVTPVNGASTTVNSGTDVFYVSAATLASVTIVMATTGVVTNQKLRIATRGILTSVNFSGATLVNPPLTLAAGSGCLFFYDGTNWNRIG